MNDGVDEPARRAEPQASVAKRAVILVPGWGRYRRNERRDVLVENLTRNGPMPVDQPTDGAIEGMTFRRLTPIAGQTAQRPVVDVFEAHWADMIAAGADVAPPARFWNATKLLFYWLFSPWWFLALRHNRSLTIGMMMSGLLILLWYLTVIVALASFVVGPSSSETGATSGDAGFTGVFDNLVELLKPLFAAIAPVASNELFLLLLVLLPILRIDMMAATGDFTRLYLSTGTNQGYDAIILQRLKDTLQRIYDQRREGEPDRPEYDEVVVLGHSLGGVIGLEALVNYGNPAVQERTILITWGSPLVVLSYRSPERVGDRIRKACAGRVPRWFDVYSPKDWLSAQLPEHNRAYPNASMSPRLTVAWWQPVSQRAHDQYYYHEDTLAMLLAPRIAIPSGGAGTGNATRAGASAQVEPSP